MPERRREKQASRRNRDHQGLLEISTLGLTCCAEMVYLWLRWTACQRARREEGGGALYRELTRAGGFPRRVAVRGRRWGTLSHASGCFRGEGQVKRSDLPGFCLTGEAG